MTTLTPDPAAEGDAAPSPTEEARHGEHEQPWEDSSWDLRRGLDIAELDELPAEWRNSRAPR